MKSTVSYGAFSTSIKGDLGLFLRRSLRHVHGKSPLVIPGSGGSIPIAPFVTTLNIPAVLVPTVNFDNNQHSPNENLRLGNFENGIKTMISILTEEF